MQPSENERILAALAHASMIANPLNCTGLLAAGLIWATQREKSAYVRGQALQALAYQSLVLGLLLLLLASWGMCVGLSLLPVLLRPDLHHSSMPAIFWVALLGGGLPLLLGLCAMLYALYSALQCLRGRPFRYLLIGRLVADSRPGPATAPDSAPPATPTAPSIPATADDAATSIGETKTE